MCKPKLLRRERNLISPVLYNQVLCKPCQGYNQERREHVSLKPPFQESSYLPCHSRWRCFKERTLISCGSSLISECAKDVRGRTAVWCHKQADRPLLQQLLKKKPQLISWKYLEKPQLISWKSSPVKGHTHLYKGNVTKSSLPSGFKRRVRRILKPWLMQWHTCHQTEDSICALTTSIRYLPLVFSKQISCSSNFRKTEEVHK